MNAPAPPDADELEILEKLNKSPKDEDGWRRLFSKFWPFVFSQASAFLGGSSEMAEEVTQEVFGRLVQYRPFERLRNPAGFRFYLRIIVKNASRDLLGRKVKQDKIREEERIALLAGQAAKEAPREGLLQEFFEQLNSEDQGLLNFLLRGLNMAEIAEELGTSYGTAAVRVHRLKRQLRELHRDSSQ